MANKTVRGLGALVVAGVLAGGTQRADAQTVTAGFVPSSVIYTNALIGGSKVYAGNGKRYSHWVAWFDFNKCIKDTCHMDDFTLDPFKYLRDFPALKWYRNDAGNVWEFWGTEKQFKDFWPDPGGSVDG